ncbi:hypothetical protein [Candidatus Phytoplasma australiense]|uniref:Uncharacterized protein n=1 Tax=Strawberry lethal yellows phytoplasma (CPA) str. NZSb11 TaxID=980422 RepID=R4S1W9_PHYAS|nr:hypothetical protein [Candidatus Phytoplasma australiense]AGL90819.1 Hypothetical Protein SLY_0904 [Strawberry lethal yellows phytoplasma (CPA) str. NZSb11]
MLSQIDLSEIDNVKLKEFMKEYQELTFKKPSENAIKRARRIME